MNEGKKDVLKVVLDTNILVSSIFWEHGNPHKILEKVVRGEIKIFLSKEIFDELYEVLVRDFNEPLDIVRQHVGFILTYAEQVELSYDVDAVKEDPDDNVIINCALSAGADYIVSGDRHLLNLKSYNSLKIVSAREFLDILEGRGK